MWICYILSFWHGCHKNWPEKILAIKKIVYNKVVYVENELRWICGKNWNFLFCPENILMSFSINWNCHLYIKLILGWKWQLLVSYWDYSVAEPLCWFLTFKSVSPAFLGFFGRLHGIANVFLLVTSFSLKIFAFCVSLICNVALLFMTWKYLNAES